jgi:N-dimethylarginine dimethylaminohydrolase
MLRVSISPTTFRLFDYQHKENIYVDTRITVDEKKVTKQHTNLENAFKDMIVYTIKDPQADLSDIVFVANGGLSIPQIPNVVILPHMKYMHRKQELPYLKKMFEDIGITTIPFPGNSTTHFEGQAEIKWFHGGARAICGYGFRATKGAFAVLKKMLDKLYKKHGLDPVELLVLPLESPLFYHLDVAMLEFGGATSQNYASKCIVHKNAFSEQSVEKMRNFLGADNVFVIDTPDTLCLNAVVDGQNLITRKLTDRDMKPVLEGITGRHVKEVDVSEFEKSGGSVRCMVMDLHPSTARVVAKKLIGGGVVGEKSLAENVHDFR